MQLRTKRKLELRAAIVERDGMVCRYCKRTLIEPGDPRRKRDWLTVDHVFPKALGGKSRLRNLVACCWRCNHEKGDAHPLKDKHWSGVSWMQLLCENGERFSDRQARKLGEPPKRFTVADEIEACWAAR